MAFFTCTNCDHDRSNHAPNAEIRQCTSQRPSLARNVCSCEIYHMSEDEIIFTVLNGKLLALKNLILERTEDTFVFDQVKRLKARQGCSWCNGDGNLGGGSLGERSCQCVDDLSPYLLY